VHKLVQNAVLEHLEEQEEFTGALLITFRDGRPRITGLIDERDEIAMAWIEGLIDAVEAPITAADDASDRIGLCQGQA
jgi:hypothetical protein